MKQFNDFLKRILWGGLDVFFPRICIGCGTNGVSLCRMCLNNLPEAPWDTGEPKDVYALFDYQNHVVKKMIWFLKYKGGREIAYIGGEMLYEKIVEFLGDRIECGEMENPILLPVPVSKRRLRERGFNQAALLVKEIARHDEDGFFDTSTNILRKIKHTVPQTSLKERSKRLQNIRGCFAVASPEKVRGRNIIIVDDVYTTGGTIFEARRVLKEAGAKRVMVFTIAH